MENIYVYVKKKLYINMYTYKNRILNTIKYRYMYI